MRNTNDHIEADDAVIRILELLQEKGRRQKDLIDYLGISNSTFSRWKYCHGKTYFRYLDQTAEFLGTTSEYIAYGKANKEIPKEDYKLTDADYEMVRMIHEIDDQGEVEAIYRLIESIWACHHPKQKTGSCV